MLGFLSKRNKEVESKWLKVSELKVGMQIAVPKDNVLDSHMSGFIDSRELMVDGDVLWDEIESIEYVGREQVWDIEVENTHNFIGNNIFAHNTYISGNLGIGTTAPKGTLDVYAANGGGVQIAPGGFSTIGNNIYYSGGAKYINTSTATLLDIASNGDYEFFTASSGTAGTAVTLNSRFIIKNSGNLGIGTTGPATKLEIGSSDLGDGVAGPVITLGRNTNATNTGAGSINFLGKAGTAGYVWQDAAGNLRIHTAAPTNANDTAGTVVGAQTSIRDSKQDINDYTDYKSALVTIVETPLHTFRYKKEVAGYGTDSPLAKVRIGYIADEVSSMFMVGNSIDQVSVNGLLIASIKELDIKFVSLEDRVLALEENANNGESGGGLLSSLGEYAQAFFSTVVKKVENGVVFMRGLVVDTLKIGSPTRRTGVTLYDEITGEPYCLSIANGGTKTTAGECVVVVVENESSSSSSSDTSGGNGGNNSTSSSTDTTVPVITLNGESSIILAIGDTYIEEGATAIDDVDGETMVITSGSVDTNTSGIYTVSYTAMDTAGNTALAQRIVSVNGTSENIVENTEALPPSEGGDTEPISDPAPESTSTPEPIPEPIPTSEPESVNP